MSKKIMLLALVAVSAAVFALPATASAIVPLHVVPKPVGMKTVDGVGGATLTGNFGHLACSSFVGLGESVTTTTGTIEGTAKGCTLGGTACTTSGQLTGVITTEKLPVELATVVDTPTGNVGPGVLVTPNAATGQFATFSCGFLGFTLKGNGVIGTITSPVCGASSNEATINFSSSSTGVQTHKTLAGTAIEYNLTVAGSEASVDGHGTVTIKEAVAPKLECT